jgi:microcystin-dependent protein
MSEILESSTWENTIYRIAKEDLVLGGTPIIEDNVVISGVANVASQQLTNRTNYLKDRADVSDGNINTLNTQMATAITNIATAAHRLDILEPVVSTITANVVLATDDARQSASAAATSATNAGVSANQAAASATTALTAGPNAAAAAASATSASTSATNANTSAIAADISAQSATASKNDAATSATSASASASSAATSASNANANKNAAATSATNAGVSQTAAAISASDAATSATSATASKNAAATSATNAGNSASAASTSQTAAATSATNAGNSASAASTSATNAASSATASAGSATAALGSANNSANSATAASTSQTAAATSATNAASSATAASTSASAASTYATNAGNSATAAAGSASAAATSATNAAASATTASNAQTTVAASATTATNAATAASTSQTAAAGSATAAASSASDAAASAAAALAYSVPHYKGYFTTYAALVAGTSGMVAGDYADVDAGTGTDAKMYIWDTNDTKWVVGNAPDPMTSAQVKTLYEANLNTNAYTDAEKTKLGGIAASATSNSSDAVLLARANHTGTQAISTVVGLQTAIDGKEPVITSGTTSGFWRGDKVWTDFATTVRATILTGLSVATSTATSAADTILVAIGKLQAQITGLSTSKLDATANSVSATKLQTARTINSVSFDGTANITIADGTKEPVITAGTTAQYWKGDKSWATLDKTAVGLGSVDNTSDVSKPVSTAAQTALDSKQDALGFTPVQQGGGTGQGTNKVYIGGAGGGLKATVDSTDLGAFVFAGANSSITSLTGLTTALSVAQGGTGTNTATGTGNVVLAASPTLTGTPLAPTATAGTNTTQLATTAFVTSAVAAGGSTPPGTVNWFATMAAPTGFLSATGAAISRSTYSTLFSAITAPATGTVTSGSAVITSVPSTQTMWVGMPISGPGIPLSATILSIVANTSITMSINATATTSGATLAICPFGVGDGSTTFNVPDLRGRTARGWDNGAGVDVNRVYGSYQADAYASHNHGVTDPGHFHSMGVTTGTAYTAGGVFSAIAGSTNTGSKTTGISINNSGGTETVMKNLALLPCIKY